MIATFGIPEVAEDDAERAVRAGIEIQERFTRFAEEVSDRYGETLTARVGVNTGEIVIGAGDADLVGDALNVAARLVHALRELVEQVPDLVVIVERIESSGRAVLAENHQVGTSADGLAVDWQWHLVFSMDGEGLIELMEYFDADDDGTARARARFEELAGCRA